jgi:hypothetical protein
MSNARQLTAALPARAHSERLALAVVDLLTADPVIASDAWCGTNPVRVYRVPEATLYPDRPRPMITVAPDFKSLPLRLQGESEAELRLLLTLFYDEPRSTLDSRALIVPRWAGRPLVQRPPRTADMTLAEVVEVLDDGTPVVHRQPQLQITYSYTLSRDTGQPEGFDDDD